MTCGAASRAAGSGGSGDGRMGRMTLSLPIDDEANALLNAQPAGAADRDGAGPADSAGAGLRRAVRAGAAARARAGRVRAGRLRPGRADRDLRPPPALHRFPKAMAARVQEVCRVLVERYDGDAARLWSDAADGRELLQRVGDLPGFGKQKAQIFVALLGKRLRRAAATAGGRPPAATARPGATGRSPTSSTASRCAGYASTSSDEGPGEGRQGLSTRRVPVTHRGRYG